MAKSFKKALADEGVEFIKDLGSEMKEQAVAGVKDVAEVVGIHTEPEQSSDLSHLKELEESKEKHKGSEIEAQRQVLHRIQQEDEQRARGRINQEVQHRRDVENRPKPQPQPLPDPSSLITSKPPMGVPYSKERERKGQ